MSLILAPGRQQTSLWDESGQQVGPAVPLIRESPMTITLLFFLPVAVVMRGADWFPLVNPFDGSLSVSSSSWPLSSRASYLLCKGTWEGEVGQERIRLLRRAGICFHPPPSLRSPSSPWWQEGRGPSPSLDASIWCARLRDGREWLYQSISLSSAQNVQHLLEEQLNKISAIKNFCAMELRLFCITLIYFLMCFAPLLPLQI